MMEKSTENPLKPPPRAQISMAAAVENPRSSFEVVSNAEDSNLRHAKVPFFNSRSLSPSRRRRITRDTWLISLFVLLEIVVFIATMAENNCWTESHGDCTVKLLRRMSFQPLSENPLLGPSASTLDKMGALQHDYLVKNHEVWRLFTAPWLHAGLLNLVINLGSIIFVGIYMEQEFGPLRIAMIYVLSSFGGCLFAAAFIRNVPSVCSSSALFGLIGAMLSALIRDWDFYSHKLAALALILIISTVNFLLGLLPYVNNFSNIGGFISGFLLGFVLLFTPQLRQVVQHKVGLFEYDTKSSIRLKEKLDKPVLRITCLLLFSIIFAGCLIAALQGVNINCQCRWCQYVDCLPLRIWSCNDMTTYCEAMVSDNEMTLTCMSNGNFKVFPYTNISEPRTRDLCTVICS